MKSTASVHTMPATSDLDADEITVESVRDAVSVRLDEIRGLVEALAVCDGGEQPAWINALGPSERSGVLDALARLVRDTVAIQHSV